MADVEFEKLNGDASLVAKKAQTYVDIADAIKRSLTTLDAITDDITTKSLAMDATRKLASEVREDIAKAQNRYRETGEALQTYSTELQTAKTDADGQVPIIESLEQQVTSAKSAKETATENLTTAKSTADMDGMNTASDDLTTASNNLSDLEEKLETAKSKWRNARDAKDTAAHTAAGKINDVINGPKANGLTDGFGDHVREIAHWVYKVFKVICDIAGILAIFLSWVPVLGQVLLALAAIGAILDAVEAFVKAAKGEGSWWAALGAAGLAALSVFGGKAVSLLAKYSKARAITHIGQLGEGAQKLQGLSVKVGERAAAEALSGSLKGASKGTWAFTILKSPFVRSASDIEKAGNVGKALSNVTSEGWSKVFSTAFKGSFPNPFKDFKSDFLLKSVFGNGDVVDALEFANKAGDLFTPRNAKLLYAAAHGSFVINAISLGNRFDGITSSIHDGDWANAAESALKIPLGNLNGPYGSLVGGATKYAPLPWHN